tara:strand:- start:119 stop:319 length:201 start_codon:yes stop_codon:yes gene_type:complete
MSEVEPITCPTCGSDDISYVKAFEDGAIEVMCQDDDCMSEWWEVWNFSHIEMIEGKDNRYVDGEEE